MDLLTNFFWTWPHWVGFGVCTGLSLFCFFGFMSEAIDTSEKREERRKSARYSLASFFIGIPASAVWFVAIPVALIGWVGYGMLRLFEIAELGGSTE